MNPQIQAPVSRTAFQQWLEADVPLLQVDKKGSCTTVLKLPKTEQFDYLFCARNYQGPGVHWSSQFQFCGIFSRQGGTLQIAGSELSRIVENLTAEECMDHDTLRDRFCAQVNAQIEKIIAEDRNNLTVTEISSKYLKKDLEYYQEFGAAEEAIRIFFAEGDPDICFHSDYKMERWSEEAVLAYLQDPDEYVRTEADTYIKNYQEELLAVFLMNDTLKKAYTNLMQDAENPIHRMKAITDAVNGCGAKTVRVTVQKDGEELTFRTDADSLRGYQRDYSTYGIPASELRDFEGLFGQFSRYTAMDITKITYGRNTIYEAPPVQTEDAVEELKTGGMQFG